MPTTRKPCARCRRQIELQPAKPFGPAPEPYRHKCPHGVWCFARAVPATGCRRCVEEATGEPVPYAPPAPAAAAVVGVIRRLIHANNLHAHHGEDTIGVLMKCGAFHESADPRFVTDLAIAIDRVEGTVSMDSRP